MNFEFLPYTLVLVAILIAMPMAVYKLYFFDRPAWFMGLLFAGVHLLVFIAFFIFLHSEAPDYFAFEGYWFGFMILDFPAIVLYYMSLGVTFIFLKLNKEVFSMIREIIAFGLFGTLQYYIIGTLMARGLKKRKSD
jgi:hypothetical protein